MSRLISWPQPTFPAGSGLAWPFWFTFRKQPEAIVHCGSPNWLRYSDYRTKSVVVEETTLGN